ncbi:MAG: DUF4221 domain-containing protein [Microscillaceae bacterium]|nr:DUF4221 domain-containing protein [Microscillaceae bacterium]
MKRIILYKILLIALFFYTCADKQADSIKKVNLNTHKLVKKSSKKFQLDTLSSYKVVNSLQFFREGGIDYFAFLNSQAASIYLYDYNTSALKKIIKIAKEGPNSIGFPIQNCYIKNLDSIFVIAGASPYFYLVNQESKILKKYKKANWDNMDSFKTRDSVFAMADDAASAYVLGKDVYMIGRPYYASELHGNNSISLKINLETGNFSKLPFSYPKLYQEKYFGKDHNTLFALIINRVYNERIKKFIYAFPAEENMYVTDIEHKENTQVFAGSDFCDEIKPLTKKEAETFTQSSFQNWSLINSRCYYSFLRYNPFQDYYYRMVFLPEKSQENIINLKPSERKFNFILLDKSFKKIGEQPFDKSYRMLSFVQT